MSRLGIYAYPKRITEARQARAYNISQLAGLVGVTRQSMSRYEQGLSHPSEKVIGKLSQVLDFPFDFFYKPIKDTITSDSTVFYRSLKSSEANIRSMIKIKCDWASEMYNYLDQYLELPSLNLPNLDLLITQDSLSDKTIENIAVLLRKHWNLGNAPIDNLTYILEKNGFIISCSSIGSYKVDACSEVRGGKPIIFLGKGQKSSCRTRFNLAHELGHVIMHNYITKEDIKNSSTLKRIEREANRFASSFLLPYDSFLDDVRSLSLDYFILMKRKWKVSIAAMVYRCQDLKLFDEDQILALRKQMSYKHWNRNEPLDKEIKLEQPKLLTTAINIIFNKGIVSKSEFLNTFKWNVNDLSDICGCDPELFKNTTNINIPLKLL